MEDTRTFEELLRDAKCGYSLKSDVAVKVLEAYFELENDSKELQKKIENFAWLESFIERTKERIKSNEQVNTKI